MKTNKFFSVLVMLVISLCTVVTFTSCNDDDESSNSIVGTWSCDNHYYKGTDTYTFRSNGTYTWSYAGSGNFQGHSGIYSFDNSRSTLTIRNDKGTTWLYFILSLTSSSFTMMDEEGDTYYYSKK